MTTQTIFKEFLIKSITVPESGQSSVGSLVQAVVKGSRALQELPIYPTKGKTTFIPFIKVPGVGDTTYTIGALDLVKELGNASATLTDETDEDTFINVSGALDNVMNSQARLKVENYIADYFSDDARFAPAGGASTISFATIVSHMVTFGDEIIALDGKFVAMVSFANYITMLSTMDNAHRELVKAGIVTLVPIAGMEANKLVLLHTQGVAIDFNIYNLETFRNGEIQADVLYSQFTMAAAADTSYIRNVTLA